MTSNRVKQKTSGGAFGATWQRVSLIVTFIIMLVVNGLAGSTTVIGGVDTATISDSYPNLFAPAGITFSIWGVIYVLLIGYVAAIALGLPKKTQYAAPRDRTNHTACDHELSA